MLRKISFVTLISVLISAGFAQAVRVETLATVKGMLPLRVSGKSLVTGLNNSGDKSDAAKKMLKMFLDKNGINLAKEDIDTGSIALVNVTTEIPASSRPGVVLPVQVAAINAAQNLENGVLIKTFLRAKPGGSVYAVATGRLLIGGEGPANQFPTTAIVAAGTNSGAQVVRANAADFISDRNTFELILKKPSFANAYAIEQAINSTGETNPGLEKMIEQQEGPDVFSIQVHGTAQALDPGTVIVQIPDEKLKQKVKFIMSVLKNVNVSVDVPPCVVIDRATNNVTITGEVRVSRAAIIQGNLSIMVEAPDTKRSAKLIHQPQERWNVVELSDSLGQAENLQTLINTLNAMQVTPRDVANILQKLKVAGALHAELKVE